MISPVSSLADLDPGTAARKAVANDQELGRIGSLDTTRGLIVALMALDHVRIYFSAAQFDPMDLGQTDPGWYLARWVTHLCAPGFFFIMGLGAALMKVRMTAGALTAFLLVRGLWLILLELTVIGFAWSFTPGWFWFGVIFSLGAAMMLLALTHCLPRILLFILASAFILLHNEYWATAFPMPEPVDAILYSGGVIELPAVGPRLALYSILPWAALAVLG